MGRASAGSSVSPCRLVGLISNVRPAISCLSCAGCAARWAHAQVAAGRCALQEEVVPLDGGADEAGGDDTFEAGGGWGVGVAEAISRTLMAIASTENSSVRTSRQQRTRPVPEPTLRLSLRDRSFRDRDDRQACPAVLLTVGGGQSERLHETAKRYWPGGVGNRRNMPGRTPLARPRSRVLLHAESVPVAGPRRFVRSANAR